MFMAGTGSGGCGVGQGPGSSSGSCNPRKFSEKIALLTQRQAEDTAAFQEVMMDITSTRIQVQRARQARSFGTYYGGSLPNVNQIGRSTSDVQVQLPCSPDNGCPIRLHPMSERTPGEGRLSFPVRPNRRHTDNSPYRSVHPSPPPEPSWRRNWSSTVDKSQQMHLPITALNRTNSDSALHTSVRNTHTGDHLSPNQQALTSRNRRGVFPYPVPPIEENVLEEGKPLRNTKKCPALPTGIKSRKFPGVNILSSPDQQFSALNVPSALNVSGSLPDLSSLHLPSPQPVGVDPDKPTACSTGHLPGTPSHLGARDDEFPLPGLSLPLQGSYSNPLLQSSHSIPNIQSSLSSHSLSSSLSSTSLNFSLSNTSLQSSPSNQSLQSFLSSSSLSGLSLQSTTSHCSYSSGIGGSRSCSSSSLSCSPRPTSQTQVPPSRRRTPLSPLVVPTGGESRWLQSKQFSPVGSPKLSSITQGVLLNTNQLPQESRPPGYRHCQPQHEGTPAAQQPMHRGLPQRQHSLTEGQQQPRQEPQKTPPPHEKSRDLQQRGVHQQQQQQQQQHPQQHPQQQLPQTHNLQRVEYHHQQQYQHPNQVYQCQIQHVQTEGQDLDTKQQRQSVSNQCENLQQQHLHQLQKEQHQRQQEHQQQQKQVYQNLPQQQQEKQRQQYQLHQQHPHQQNPHQQQYQQQACQRQPQQHRALRQDEVLQQQQQLQQFQPYQQQQRQNGNQQQQHQWHLQCAYPPSQSLNLSGQNMTNPQKVPTMQMTRKHQTQVQGRSWAHQKVQGQKDQIQSTKLSSQMNSFMDNSPDLYNDSSILDHFQNESYMGLHLTPSQTQALSQQLGQLSKEPLWGDSGPQSVVGKDGGVYCGIQVPQMSAHCHNQNSVDCHNILMTDKTAFEDFSGVLPMLGFDADPFALDNPLQIDPLDLEELNKLADGDMVEDSVKGHCSNLLR
ncbi:CREB-regulated transcription coactivator 2 isoform X1 [Oncorhynchus mykiss]|uniref:Transducer of regulated CREB activity N-terminal domain-containing protein n=1 Tax=Oncorhynchus mykiss TaxID=8022 RepID=A0A8C7S2E0_ONCMY|nr:CREB-regulated transcription coactivator 2 isoform X1 [Oncorhynchus mykiss]